MNGWTFGLLSPQVLGLSLAAAAAVTVALYLLRLRRRPLLVPFIQLWESLILDKKAAALRSQLKRLLSLLLSLLLVFLLILAFADPRSPSEQRGRHLVVLLDAGITMSDPGAAGDRSCLSVAQKRVESWFSSLGPGDEMLLVELGALPRPLDSFTSDRARLKRALDQVQALDVVPNLQAGLALAQGALRGHTAPEIILITDGQLRPEQDAVALSDLPPLRLVNVSEFCPKTGRSPADSNLSIELFSARRYPLAGDRFEVLLNVAASGNESIPAEITIRATTEQGAPGAVLEVARRDIFGGELESFSFANLGQAERGLLAQVARTDGRSERTLVDNEARAVLSKRLPVHILVVGPTDNFLEAALLLEDSLIVKRVSEEQYPPNEEFDITIFNHVAPVRDPRGGAALYLGVAAPREDEAQHSSHFPLTLGAELRMFGFDTWDKSSRVFQLVDPYDVQVLSGYELKPAPLDQVLGASAGRPILVSGTREQGRFLALGFEPTSSDFVLRPAWPLFVLNLIDELYPRGRGEGIAGGNVARDLRIPVLDPRAAKAQVLGPLRADRPAHKVTVPVINGYAVVYSQQAGFFDISTGIESTRIALSADHPQLDESDQALAPLSAPSSDQPTAFGPYQVSAPKGMEPRPNYDPWFWLLGFVLLVSFLEWWAFHRRWTV